MDPFARGTLARHRGGLLGCCPLEEPPILSALLSTLLQCRSPLVRSIARASS